jgi:hypothetical protein
MPALDLEDDHPTPQSLLRLPALGLEDDHPASQSLEIASTTVIITRTFFSPKMSSMGFGT